MTAPPPDRCADSPGDAAAAPGAPPPSTLWSRLRRRLRCRSTRVPTTIGTPTPASCGGSDSGHRDKIGSGDELGLEVIHAICTLPRPIGMDHGNQPFGQKGSRAYERTRAILDRLQEGVVVVDARGHVVLANGAARRSLHLHGRAKGSSAFLDRVQPELRPYCARGLDALRRDGRRDYQIHAIQADLNVFDLSFLRLAPHQDPGGELAMILVTDIGQLNELDRLADDFLSSISHDLRTPLTNICAATEILSEMPPSEPAERCEFLEIIGREAERLTRLLDDVLRFSQLESSHLDWELADVAVIPALTRCCEAYMARHAERLHHKRLQIEVIPAPPGSIDLPPDTDHLGASLVPSRLPQLIDRLLDNAVKFTPCGGRIEVRAWAGDDETVIAVEDDGPGVDAADRETVFDRFWQLRDPLKEKPAGLGLGLATCKRIVRRMGGRIWCDDATLGGARFAFALRRVPAPDGDPAAPASRPTDALSALAAPRHDR